MPNKNTAWNQVDCRPTGNVVVSLSDRPGTLVYAVEQFEVLEERTIAGVGEIRTRLINGEPLYERDHPELHWAFVVYEEARKALLKKMVEAKS